MGGPPPPITREESNERYPDARILRGFASPEYWTEERRAEQREKALRMVQEGRFGGRRHNHGGRPRIKKAHEILAEKAQEHADEMERRLLEMLRSRKDGVALAAIQQYLRVEEMAAKTAKDEEERELARMSGGQLDEALLAIISEAFGLDLGDIIDVEPVDENDLVLASAEEDE